MWLNSIIHSKPSDEHQKQLYDLFGLSLSFWSKYEQEASGYFAAYDYPDSANALGAHTTALRLLIKVAKTPEHPNSKDYAWLEFGIFTHWVHGGKVHVLVQCGDQPTTIDVMKQLRTEPVRRRCTRDPYAVQAYVLEHLVKEFDASVWSWRDRVRQFEKDRLKPKTKAKAVDMTSEPDPDYQRMHEVARHVIHCTEMLATAINVVDSIIEEHSAFLTDNYQLLQSATFETRNVTSMLRRHRSFLKAFHLRSQALQDRLSNEIHLVSNGRCFDSKAMLTLFPPGICCCNAA